MLYAHAMSALAIITFLLLVYRGDAARDFSPGANPEGGGTALRTYELVFIAQPELDEEALTALVASIKQIVTDNGGEIVKAESMGRRRLAYPIGRYNEGHYVLIHAGMERLALNELERRLKLSEDVIRHLVVRLDELA